jgi:hypothetical protein
VRLTSPLDSTPLPRETLLKTLHWSIVTSLGQQFSPQYFLIVHFMEI